MATTVSGPVLAVNSFTQGRPVWERRGLGSQASVVMVGQISPEDRKRARSLGLDLTPLSLQQLVVHASGRAGRRRRTTTAPLVCAGGAFLAG